MSIPKLIHNGNEYRLKHIDNNYVLNGNYDISGTSNDDGSHYILRNDEQTFSLTKLYRDAFCFSSDDITLQKTSQAIGNVSVCEETIAEDTSDTISTQSTSINDDIILGDKLGIIVYKFPAKANTFIVNEIMELLDEGINFHIYSIGNATKSDKEVYSQQYELLKDKITYVSRHGLMDWNSINSQHIPLMDNKFKKEVLKNKDVEFKNKKYELAVKRSKQAFKKLIDHVQHDNITKLYAPFAGTDADICTMINYHTDIPFYFTCHAYDLFCYFGYEDIKLKNASHIFSISEYNKKYLIEKYNVPEDKISIKRVNFISSIENPTPLNIEYEYIFSAGRLVQMKGFKYAIDSFKEFHELYPDVHYVIAGDGTNKNSLLQYIDNSGLSKYVHILSHVPNEEVMSWIQDSLFCMLTSIVDDIGDMEGLPTFFVEAMSLGKSCIGTRYSGIPELIDHNKNGFLVDAKDVDGIIHAMIRLYDIVNSDRGIKFSNNAKKKIDDMFNNKNSIKIMLNELCMEIK